MSTQPYDFGQAVAAAHRASDLQRGAEDALRDAVRTHANSERLYRSALARKIVELRAQGDPVTLAADLARGDENVAALRYERDVADGLRKVAEQQAWRRAADRKDVRTFIDWSQRAAFLDLPEFDPLLGGAA